MQAIILAGGQNTRMRHLFPFRPKILFPVGGVPFLHHHLELLVSEGVTDIILATKYRSWLVEAYVALLPSYLRKKVRIIKGAPHVKTTGELVAMERELDHRFFLFYGDILFHTDLRSAWRDLHEDRVASSFITQDEFGMYDKMELMIDEASRSITQFNPYVFERGAGWLDVGGLYRKSIISDLKKTSPTEEHLNKTIWPDLIARHALTYHKVGPIVDIGTEPRYRKTTEIFSRSGLGSLSKSGYPTSSPQDSSGTRRT